MKRWALWILTGFIAAAAPRPVAARAQETPGGHASGDAIERVAAALSEARDAQAAFERARVARLPWARSRPPRPCEEIVGRFCYWHDGSGGDWTPPPEPAETTAARERLIERLAAAAAEAPADGWIAGQRVRYVVEAGRGREAAALARACRAERWWCAALEGYALHAAGEFAAAESVFDRALGLLPAGDRERWSDPALILDRDLARAWKRIGPAGREAFLARLWWLADPLWSVPGNERRTEHYARHVLDRLAESARTPYDTGWGRDLRELTIRYGWPAGWERARPDAATLGGSSRPGVVAHDPPGGRRWIPSGAVLAAPESSAPSEWPLDPSRPRATYAPAYADSVVPLAHQLAVFRRGDRALVIAGYDLEAGGAEASAAPLADRAPSAALILALDPDAPPRIARGEGARGALVLEAAWSPVVASLEARAGRRTARARYGLPLPPRERAVSDLLLLVAPAPLPSDIDAAARAARGTVEVAAGERLGTYFEIYPPAAGSLVAHVAIVLRDRRGGFWRSLGGALGLGGSREAAGLAWTEALPAGAEVIGRSLVIELPRLPRGDYALELEVLFPTGPPHRSIRPIVLR